MSGIPPVLKQFLTIICCNLLTLSVGISDGWATVNFVEFQNENTTLATGPLTLDEASWVMSLMNIGALIGNLVILPISHLLGMKRTIHVFALPLILSSALVILAQNVYYLYVARVLKGIVGSAAVIGIPTFINEISHDNVRGALCAIQDPSFNLGIIIAFFLANSFSVLDQVTIQLVLLVIFAIVLFLFPDSPEYWRKRNKDHRALKSQAFYKGTAVIPEHVEFIQKIQDEKIENGKSEEVDDENDSNSKLTLQDFFTPQAKKAFSISITMLVLCICSGSTVILSYVTVVFIKTGSPFSESNSSILILATKLIGNLVLLNIVERFNRRTLYIGSSILTMASYFLFAAYCSLWTNRPELQWMPPFCFACIIYFSCMGLLPIPYIVTIEILPKKIRKFVFAAIVSLMWFIGFVLLKIFPILMQQFDLPICLTTLGVLSSLSAIYGYLFVPETRGKSHKQIKELLK